MTRLGRPTGLAAAWADLGLGAKGLIVVALPLAILLASIGGLHLSGRAQAEAEAQVRLTFAIQRDIHEVHALLAEAASGVRGYRLTGRRAFLEPYVKAEALLPDTLDRLRRTARDGEIRQRLERVDRLVIQKREGLAQLAAMPDAGTSTGLQVPEVTRALIANKAVLDQLRAEIEAMQAREAELLAQRQAKADDERRRTWALSAVLAGVGLLGGLAAAQLLFTGIVRRVRGLEQEAERLERGEPLDTPDAARDEIGGLARRLSQASALLRSREAALREGEERYRRVIEGVRDYGIFALDVDGRVVSWNAGAERIKGWSAEEILGQHFSTFYPADTRAETPARLLEVARREGRVEDEGWRLRRDGRRFWANVVITALYDDDGVLTGFSKVTRDVTERRRADEALGQARAEAERASRAKTDFLSRMSHELRTPLTAILGFNQLLDMDRETLTDDQVHAVDQIGKAGAHLRAMIEEVLDIAQIEAGGHALSPTAVAIQPLIEDVRSLTGPQAAAAGVEIRLASDGDPSVMADRRATLQIILNLVSNAIKYGARGGVVEIEVAPCGANVCIMVSDEGPGISPDMVDRLFTPFDRLDAERWSGVDGSGLGLALSKGLARAQGGDIVYRAREDRSGAVFVLTLPRSNLSKEETE